MAWTGCSRFAAIALVAGFAGGLPLLAPQVQAQSVVAAVNPVAAMAIVDAHCSTPAMTMAAPLRAAPTTVKASKSAAILGGEMSALERMRMQQTDPAAAFSQNDAIAEIATLSPAAGNMRPAPSICATDMFGAKAEAISTPLNTVRTGDFLASKRVRIGKTNFDQDWRRVRKESVRGTLRKEFGREVKPSLELIGNVNRWVNREIDYVEDRDLFGQADYWAGARRTLRLGKGDCEDFALTKLQLLAAAGIDRDDMFLTIARDRVRNADHALLVVRFEGRYLVLDNATDQVLDGEPSHDYLPVLSFNNTRSWLHGF